MEDITVVATPDLPYATDCFDQYPKRCANPGAEIATVYAVLKTAGFNVIWKKVKTTDDIWDMLRNGSADMSGYEHKIDSVDLRDLPKIPGVSGEILFFVIPRNQVEFVEHHIFEIFGWKLWILVGLTLIFFFLFINPAKCELSYPMVKRRYGSVTFITWIVSIAVTVVLGVYGNCLSLEMYQVSSQSDHIFETLEELVEMLETKQSHLIIDKYIGESFPFLSPRFYNFSKDTDKLTKLFWKAEQINPPSIIDDDIEDYATIIKFVHEKEKSFPLPILVVEYHKGRQIKFHSNGALATQSYKKLSGPPMALFFRPNSTALMRKVSAVLSHASIDDLYEKMCDLYESKIKRAELDGMKQSSMDLYLSNPTLRLFHLANVFWLLMTGLGVGILIMVAEQVVFYSAINKVVVFRING